MGNLRRGDDDSARPGGAEPYRREDGISLIELNLATIQQLFNSLDPSPFHEKDLDSNAEEYIVGAVRELPLHAPLRLVFHVADSGREDARLAGLPDAIHHYFRYRRGVAQRDLRFQLRIGQTSLAIGLGFLGACIALRQIFFAGSPGTIDQILSEGLLISGWVAMWRPLQLFLYDWWPLRRMVRVYAKLAEIPVEVRRAKTP